MKDFRDFVKATYAGLIEVEGLNEAKEIAPLTAAIKTHPDTQSKLALRRRFSGSTSKSGIGFTHSVRYESNDPKHDEIQMIHKHHFANGTHEVTINRFPSDRTGPVTWHQTVGKGSTAYEAYDNALKPIKPVGPYAVKNK